MSILIAYKKDGAIYMGTDTRVIVNENKRQELCESCYKIQKLDNGMLVGIVGDRVVRQIVHANSEIFTLDKKGKLTREHIIKSIYPKLIELLKREDKYKCNGEDLPHMDIMILLAHEETLYEICRGFTLLRYEDFQALGEGSDWAQATLFNIKETDDISDRIVKALDVVAKNTFRVGKPYLLINTKDLKYQIVKED